MARDSVYAHLVQVDMPVAERMAFAMSRKTRDEWQRADPEMMSLYGNIATDMLIQTACPTPAVIEHARERLALRSPSLPDLTDDQLADIWEAIISGIGGEAQNISTGFTPDGAPGRL